MERATAVNILYRELLRAGKKTSSTSKLSTSYMNNWEF
jgi:hypothetical protein